MRAICEACGHMQPPDWKPGDLCTQCGTVVRREKRCHWCVQLTPDGKFCRHCGAGLVPDAQYGAARWLKHLGTDQFGIPGRLADMDPEQVEHFERLYQRHAVVAERHIDDLALAESFARQRGWARSLEDELLPLLPLPAEQLKALVLPPARGTTAAEKLLEIRESSPFMPTRLLAALARLRIWQASADDLYPSYGADRELALSALQAADASLREEAALTLSHWRLVTAGGLFGEREIVATLSQAQAAPLEATVNLVLIDSRRQGVAPDWLAVLGSEDADMAFAAALAAQVPEPLLAALRHPVRRYAAARTLTRMQVDFELASLLPDFTSDQLDELLSVIAGQQHPRPDLRAFLRDAAQGQPSRLRLDTIHRIQLLDLQPGDASQLLADMPAKPFTNHDGPDWSFIQKILMAPSLPPGEEVAVCYELLRRDLFQPQQLSGLRTIIERNGLPLAVVTDSFRTAPAKSLQGLRSVVEYQLGAHGATGPHGSHGAPVLHPFLRAILWDATARPELRELAGSILQSWYDGGYGANARPRLQLTEDAATVYFGSLEKYVEYFTYALEHLEMLYGLNLDNDFLRPLQGAVELADGGEAGWLRPFTALPTLLVERLRHGLVALARDYDRWGMVNQWAIQLLGGLQRHPAWRAGIRAELDGLRGGEYDYLIDQQLAP